jgi:hypothetical protein
VKIILTCGYAHSGYATAHEALVAAGLSDALPSRRESMAPAELHESIFKAHELDATRFSSVSQLAPGKVWQELAVDLFMGNLEQQHWGWSDPRAVWLLEFWKSFDPQIRFLLVYSTPETAVGELLQNKAGTAEEVAQAVDSWIATNAELLRFYHRNPERSILVNTAAALHAPARVVEKAREAFGLGGLELPPTHEANQASVSAVAASLAKALIEERADAVALYRELESSADLDGATVAADAEKLRAWDEYTELRSHLDNMAKEAIEYAEQAAQLRMQRAELEQRLAEAQPKGITQAHDLTQAQAALTASEAEIGKLKSKGEEFEQKAEALQLQLNKAQQDAGQAANPGLEEKNREIAQENELLLLQLHQVQEELERYFLECQKLAGNGGSGRGLPSCGQGPYPYQPVEVLFDLRREFEGDNWYYAEDDGRWAGPGMLSTFTIPALGRGRYEIRLEVIDAMDFEILTGMQVSLNGERIQTAVDSHEYPAIVQGEFSTDGLAQGDIWEFQFGFHKVISPAERGSDDQRVLAIRSRSLQFRLID